MNNSSMLRRYWPAALAAAMTLLLSPARAGDLNPAAIKITTPDKMKWVVGENGADTAILLGDPAKTGLYIIMVRWHAHHMSRPHFHPHDRYITVLSGTWWVGTGTKYDPDSTVAMPTGSFVTHVAKQVHYDGAKDADTVLQIVGEGPEAPTPAETN